MLNSVSDINDAGLRFLVLWWCWSKLSCKRDRIAYEALARHVDLARKFLPSGFFLGRFRVWEASDQAGDFIEHFGLDAKQFHKALRKLEKEVEEMRCLNALAS